jgi:hypothetical protein
MTSEELNKLIEDSNIDVEVLPGGNFVKLRQEKWVDTVRDILADLDEALDANTA